MSNIQEEIEQQRQQARTVCDTAGSTSPESAPHSDALEELQAEASDQRQTKPKNSLERYCDDNPDADECRLYDD